MGHPVMWFEVLGSDAGKLRQFYGDLFGWTFDVLPQVDYGVVKTGESRGVMGGIGKALPGERPWVTFYTETSDVTASLAKAEALGGRVIAPRTEVPGAIIGVFEDPEGHILGLVEAAKAAAQ
jgi:predicted enzyme related to lactoylglutathione lyase